MVILAIGVGIVLAAIVGCVLVACNPSDKPF